MSAYNGAAYIQRHSPRFDGPYAERGDQYLCPCQCGRILSRDWFVKIMGVSPEEYRTPSGRFVDPSDDPIYSREQRGVR